MTKTTMITIGLLLMCWFFVGCSKAYAAESSLVGPAVEELQEKEVYTEGEYQSFVGYKGTDGKYYLTYYVEQPEATEESGVWKLEGEHRTFSYGNLEELLEGAKETKRWTDGERFMGVGFSRAQLLFLNFDLKEGTTGAVEYAHGWHGKRLFGLEWEQVSKGLLAELLGVLPALVGAFVVVLGVRKALAWVKASVGGV